MRFTLQPGNPALTEHLLEHPDDLPRIVEGHLSRPMPDVVVAALLEDIGFVTDNLPHWSERTMRLYGMGKQAREQELRRRLSA